MLINRFYIEKKSGKLRPIGAPNFESRMISKAFTDMVVAITDVAVGVGARSTEQHGYRKMRGTWSAILQTVELHRRGLRGYEFDLVSFFNQITPYVVSTKLTQYSKLLSNLISNLIRGVEYRFHKLEAEAELIRNEKGNLLRHGLPQGLSLSPVLATLCLEYFDRPKNLVMYADDGIFFYETDKQEFDRWISRLGNYGIEISKEKSHEITGPYSFCGVMIDPIERTVEYQGQTVRWADPNFEK